MADQDKAARAQLLAGMANYGLLAASIAEHAAEIAHARRQLYLHYVSEGFTEAQALDLCRTLV